MREMRLHFCVTLMCGAFSFALVREFSGSLLICGLGLGDVQAFGVGGRLLRPRVLLRRI